MSNKNKDLIKKSRNQKNEKNEKSLNKKKPTPASATTANKMNNSKKSGKSSKHHHQQQQQQDKSIKQHNSMKKNELSIKNNSSKKEKNIQKQKTSTSQTESKKKKILDQKILEQKILEQKTKPQPKSNIEKTTKTSKKEKSTKTKPAPASAPKIEDVVVVVVKNIKSKDELSTKNVQSEYLDAKEDQQHQQQPEQQQTKLIDETIEIIKQTPFREKEQISPSSIEEEKCDKKIEQQQEQQQIEQQENDQQNKSIISSQITSNNNDDDDADDGDEQGEQKEQQEQEDEEDVNLGNDNEIKKKEKKTESEQLESTKPTINQQQMMNKKKNQTTTLATNDRISKIEFESLNDEINELNSGVNTLKHSYGSIIKSLIAMQNKRIMKKKMQKQQLTINDVKKINFLTTLSSMDPKLKENIEFQIKEQILLSNNNDNDNNVKNEDRFNIENFLNPITRENTFQSLFNEVEDLNKRTEHLRVNFYDRRGNFLRTKYEQQSDYHLDRKKFNHLKSWTKNLLTIVNDLARNYNDDLLNMFRLV